MTHALIREALERIMMGPTRYDDDEICAFAAEALVALEALTTQGWRTDMENAPRDTPMFYLLDVADDMKGQNFDFAKVEYGRIEYCKKGCWSSVYKAIGWYDPQVPAIPAPPTEE